MYGYKAEGLKITDGESLLGLLALHLFTFYLAPTGRES